MARVLRRIWLIQLFSTPELRRQMLSLVRKSVLDIQPALRSVYAVVAVHAGAVTRIATGDNARRKLHRPADILFYFVKSPVLINDRGIGRNHLRLFARQIAAGIQ